MSCPACHTLTSLDESGNIVFRLASKPVSIPQPEPNIISAPAPEKMEEKAAPAPEKAAEKPAPAKKKAAGY